MNPGLSDSFSRACTGFYQILTSAILQVEIWLKIILVVLRYSLDHVFVNEKVLESETLNAVTTPASCTCDKLWQ